MKISVIIPVGFKEKGLKYLLEDLKGLPSNSEILLITPDLDNLSNINIQDTNIKIRKIVSKSGRANSMNLGVNQSKGEFLWFLHADSKIDQSTIISLLDSIEKSPNDLLYFDLIFYDGPKLMKLNEIGVRLRTYFLKTPFGDQALCIKRDVFKSLGEYQTNTFLGEDHLLVRQARRSGVSITRVRAKIYTSGRKYKNNGWLKTTITHVYLWRQQARRDSKKHRRLEI